MKRFSDLLVEDREFEIGGEIFKWRYPYWEETAAIFDADVERSRNGSELPSTKQSIEDTVERILVFVDPDADAHKRFKALAVRKDNPIPLFHFSELYRWLVEVGSGRPTEQLSASDPGPGSTAASSPARSRSRAATRRR